MTCSNGIPIINILAIPGTHDSGRDIIRYYTQRTPAIRTVQEHKATSKTLEAPTALPLKWLLEKPIWVKQWPLAEDMLQALEQLVQEQPDVHHIAELTSPWNSPVFVVKKKTGK